MAEWARHVRELTGARRFDGVVRVLEDAAERDPEAAKELGHLLLRTSWGGGRDAEHWLRCAVAGRPDDVEALILLATALAARDAAGACAHYRTALRLDPGSGAAASGLALLLNETVVTGPDVPDAADAARLALEIDPDDPVAMVVLADRLGDDRMRERADASGPPIPAPRWGPGEPVSPFGRGKPGRYDFFVVEAAVEVGCRGETAPGFAVLRDAESLEWFEASREAVAYRYERGVLVAKHVASGLSGTTLRQAAAEWAGGAPGEPLPVGRPVRHDGEPLRYGVNDVQWPHELL